MTKPFHGWGHQQLEAFLGTKVTATVTAFVTVTMAATLTGKQKGQVIGANIGGVIALACIGGGIYLICTHRKRGSMLGYGNGNEVELDADHKRMSITRGLNWMSITSLYCTPSYASRKRLVRDWRVGV